MDYENEEEKVRRAELLCAMDVVARHINDEDIGDMWLVDGVPDGGDFHIFNDNTEERRKYYGDLVDCMDECDFEYTVKLFAKLVKKACFKTQFVEGGIV